MNAQERTIADLKIGINVQVDKSGNIRYRQQPQMGLPSVELIDKEVVEKLEKVLETGKLWIESRNLPAHDSLGTHTLQRVDWISDLRRDFETAIAEAVEENEKT